MFSFYFTHVIRHSFREVRKSYVCKQLFDVSRTVRDFGRETVDERRSLFDNYRVTHLKNVVKSSAIRNAFNWPLSTNDLKYYKQLHQLRNFDKISVLEGRDKHLWQTKPHKWVNSTTLH